VFGSRRKPAQIPNAKALSNKARMVDRYVTEYLGVMTMQERTKDRPPLGWPYRISSVAILTVFRFGRYCNLPPSKQLGARRFRRVCRQAFPTRSM